MVSEWGATLRSSKSQFPRLGIATEEQHMAELSSNRRSEFLKLMIYLYPQPRRFVPTDRGGHSAPHCRSPQSDQRSKT